MSERPNEVAERVALPIRSTVPPPKAIAHGIRTPTRPRTASTTATTAVAFPDGAEAVIAFRCTRTLLPSRSVTCDG